MKKRICIAVCVLIALLSIPFTAPTPEWSADVIWDPSVIYIAASGATNQVSGLLYCDT